MPRLFWISLASLLFGCSSGASDAHDHPHDHARSHTLTPAAQARFTEAEPFRQVGLMIDTTADEIWARVDGGEWRAVEITWAEGHHKVARLLLEEPASSVELRASQPWSYGVLELHDEVVASEVLTRDLPHAKVEATANALAPADLVINRAGWGARDPNKVCGDAHTPYRMAVHHTAAPADDGGDAAARMRQMQAYHIDSNGWCDIGYHFVVSQAGQVYQGRSNELRSGAHVGNQNTGNIGICLIGNFETQSVGAAQFDAAAAIMGWVGRTYDIPFNRQSILGHREHAGQSTACPGTNLLNRLGELVTQASGSTSTPAPTAPHPAAFEVSYVGELGDFYQAGTSSGKPDFFAGDTLQAEIRFKNTTPGPLRNVQLGYWFETPHLSATNYVIQTDAPGFDGATFTVNDADANPDNPAKDAMGGDGSLGLYAMAAGETKRVLVDLAVGEYSIGLADHPDVRGWVRHVDDLYGEQGAFNEDPTNANAFEALLQGFAQLDVLSRHEWQFDAGEAEQTEGWFGCSGVSPAVDPDRGMLVADFGPAGCVEAPAWTLIDAERWDQIVVRMDVEGAHEAALYWATEGADLSEARAVSFAVEGSGTYVVGVGEHPEWAGDIARLRVVPTLEGTTRAAIDAIFVQSSSGESGSAREPWVEAPPVEAGTEVPEPGDDEVVAPATPDLDEFRTRRGCTTASGSPSAVVWLFMLIAAIRRRRT